MFVKIDCQINLYGSLLFECCLEKPGIMDIDIQLKQTLQYDTLKELFEIINKSGMCLVILFNNKFLLLKVYVKKLVLILNINHPVLN